MANLNRQDYEYIFKLGADLYNGSVTAKEAGTILMAISEYVIGQQVGWPCINKRYRHLTTYKNKPKESADIIYLNKK